MRPLSNDDRYTINLEWCGHPGQRYVLRYCGDWIDSFSNLPAATLRAVGHKAATSGATIYTNQPPQTLWDATAERVQAALDKAEASA